jgi:hypothetical protein
VLMNTLSSLGNFVGMAGICLDRLLKQRSALPQPGTLSDLPPQRGGFRSLSVAAVYLATAMENSSQTFIQNPTNS